MKERAGCNFVALWRITHSLQNTTKEQKTDVAVDLRENIVGQRLSLANFLWVLKLHQIRNLILQIKRPGSHRSDSNRRCSRSEEPTIKHGHVTKD